jgi:hypothetical protein
VLGFGVFTAYFDSLHDAVEASYWMGDQVLALILAILAVRMGF